MSTEPNVALRRESALDARTRQIYNRKVALLYARHGIAVFPSSGDGNKTPLVKRFTVLDKNVTDEDRKAAEAEHKASGRPLVHIGSTTSATAIIKLWNAYPDAVPSISTGANGLLVVDPDRKKNGPALLLEAFEEHGGIPHAVPVTRTRDGGMHLYYKNDRDLPSSAGLLADLGCDVKSKGAQVVSPRAWQIDGRKYTVDPDHVKLEEAWKNGTIPPTPEWLAKLIGTKPDRANISAVKERELIKRLENTDWDSYEDDFDSTLGRYDLEELKRKDLKFAELYDNPGTDCSVNRMKAAHRAIRHWQEMELPSLSVLMRNWPGAGEYVDRNPGAGEFDDRQIVREWAKNYNPPSKGEAFSNVEVNEEAEFLEAVKGIETPKFTDFASWLEDHAAKRAEKLERERTNEVVKAEVKAEAAKLADRERELIAEIEVSKSGEPEVDEPEVDEPEDAKPAPKKRGKGPLIARGGDLWREFFPPDWVVAGMFPEVGTAMLYGDSNVGKTFVALHLLDRVSRGALFFGRRTRASDTLYVSSEGGGGLSLRLKALYDAEPFTKVSDTIMVRSDLPEFDKSPENAAKKIKVMALEARKESGRAVGVIALDNWALMLGDREENDNGFAAAVFKALSAVADELGCLILVLHHTGKDQKNYRGPSALRASVDAMYGVKMVKELTRECEIDCSKLRDGPKPPKMTYKLRTVDVTINEHGEKVTSCIVVEGHDVSTAMGAVDDTADDATLMPTDTPKDKMRGVLNALTTCINRSAAIVGDDPSEVGVPASLVFAQLNTDRAAAGLDELKDRTAVPKLLAKLEADGKIVKSGSNRQTEYRLSD